jgi:hypothetical protein
LIICLVYQTEGGVMSISRPLNNVAAIEHDMDSLLRTKKVRPLHETKDVVTDFPGEVFQLSGPSVQEIDHLIEGLRGVRQKLNTDRDYLQREMTRHAEFSETVLQLTKIVSDSMAHVQGTGPAKIN